MELGQFSFEKTMKYFIILAALCVGCSEAVPRQEVYIPVANPTEYTIDDSNNLCNYSARTYCEHGYNVLGYGYSYDPKTGKHKDCRLTFICK